MTAVKANLPAALHHSLHYTVLNWEAELPAAVAEVDGWDLILCSDLLYFAGSHKDLLETLRKLCGKNPRSGPSVLFAYEPREAAGEAAFFEAVCSAGFKCERLRPLGLTDDDMEDWRLLRMTY
eukprot:TRINITY_DN64238_c0_g1_i1.p1 TRINITY_DN64238_c0_g1~~TRINITY_DN64238_c0_g1_i1.p1  ORF type:complete len:130 (-),score=36.37 TRINITY_DN64238_c0_g1_i1:14-382(-)